MIRKFGGSSGVEFQPQGIDLGVGGGSNIKSIQRGVSTFLYADTSMNITINSVDLTKAILIIDYAGINGGFDNRCAINGEISNETTITVNRQASAIVQEFSWVVVEFNNVKSLQKGTFTHTTLTDTITISSVDINKSLLFCSASSSGGGSTINIKTTSYLSDATTISSKQGMAYTRIVKWQVIEFN